MDGHTQYLSQVVIYRLLLTLNQSENVVQLDYLERRYSRSAQSSMVTKPVDVNAACIKASSLLALGSPGAILMYPAAAGRRSEGSSPEFLPEPGLGGHIALCKTTNETHDSQLCKLICQPYVCHSRRVDASCKRKSKTFPQLERVRS